MTVGNWITLIIALLTSATAFLVADLQRRQVRQIELYRQDPSAGLKPPPHPLGPLLLRAFVVAAVAWDLGYGLWDLRDLFSSDPVTRPFVFRVVAGCVLICLGLGQIVWARWLTLFDRILDRVLETERLQFSELTKAFDAISKLTTIAEALAEEKARRRSRKGEE